MDKICINGETRPATLNEQIQKEKLISQAERNYWRTVSYDDAVDAQIRKKYSASQEFAILRQRDEKLEEYMTYYTYCEECKAFVKEKKAQYEKKES